MAKLTILEQDTETTVEASFENRTVRVRPQEIETALGWEAEA